MLKKFVSRHVKFIESIFPFKSTLTQAQRLESSTISTCLPPIIKLSTVTPTLIPPSVGGPHQQLRNEAPTVTHVTTPDSETSPINTTITQNQTPQISITNNLPTATQSNHPMQTRAKNNIHEPLQKLNIHTSLSKNSDLEPMT
jgi:hypothetical protein